jgi:hypothetical protein
LGRFLMIKDTIRIFVPALLICGLGITGVRAQIAACEKDHFSAACSAALRAHVQAWNKAHPGYVDPGGPSPPTIDEKKITPHIPEYESDIADGLNDPFSTHFRLVHASDGCPGCTGSGEGEIQVCGEMISKNSFGAYTGWHRFYAVLRGSSVRLLNFDDSPDFPSDTFYRCERVTASTVVQAK